MSQAEVFVGLKVLAHLDCAPEKDEHGANSGLVVPLASMTWRLSLGSSGRNVRAIGAYWRLLGPLRPGPEQEEGNLYRLETQSAPCDATNEQMKILNAGTKAMTTTANQYKTPRKWQMRTIYRMERTGLLIDNHYMAQAMSAKPTDLGMRKKIHRLSDPTC